MLEPRLDAPALPVWVRILDGCSVVLIVLTGMLFLYGGFRETFFGVRVVLTSWRHLGVPALAVVVVRHALFRDQPLPWRIAAALRRVWSADAVRVALLAGISTRIAVLVAGYLAAAVISSTPATVRLHSSRDLLDNLPARWDALWYRKIAQFGYSWNGNPHVQQNVVFFPALPVLMFTVGLFLDRQYVLAALLVNMAAFTGALVYLFRLARDELGYSTDRSTGAVWLLAAYPFAAYFSAAYTEGLYLLACVGAFFHLSRRQGWRAAGWGVLAGLCRPNGVLLGAALFVFVCWRAWRERRLAVPELVAVVAPAIGLGLYCAYLWFAVGDPLAWLKGQTAWGRIYRGLWPGVRGLVVNRWVSLANNGPAGYVFDRPTDLMNSLGGLFGLALIVPVTIRLGPAYGVFVVLNLLPPLLMGGTLSIGRMSAVLFPLFLWLGAAVPAPHRPAWLTSFAVLQGLVAALFFSWRPIY
jgi:Mannosyltransferase (PIG-V)